MQVLGHARGSTTNVAELKGKGEIEQGWFEQQPSKPKGGSNDGREKEGGRQRAGSRSGTTSSKGGGAEAGTSSGVARDERDGDSKVSRDSKEMERRVNSEKWRG